MQIGNIRDGGHRRCRVNRSVGVGLLHRAVLLARGNALEPLDAPHRQLTGLRDDLRRVGAVLLQHCRILRTIGTKGRGVERVGRS